MQVPPTDTQAEYHGCTIPPEVHALVFGWDPTPEIDILLFLASEEGVRPRRALEAGCGSGRLLRPLAERVGEVIGVELSGPQAAFAEQASGCRVIAGDMTRLDELPGLDGGFDLIHTSANTLRHVTDDAALGRFWRAVAARLAPGGVFIADLELGREHFAAEVGRPRSWEISRAGPRAAEAANERAGQVDAISGRGEWCVMTPPDAVTGRVRVAWRFELRSGGQRRTWSESFDLRCDDAKDMVGAVEANGLRVLGLYENRAPYLTPRPAERLSGRSLVVVGRRADA